MSDITHVTADEEKILRALAAAGGPTPTTEIVARLNPYPFGTGGDRRYEIRRSHRRDGELRLAAMRLDERGLIGGRGRTRELTPAGRGALARIDAAHTPTAHAEPTATGPGG